MIDDQEQLEADLAFSPRRTFTGRKVRGPLGATAITAFGLVYTAAQWLLTVALASKTTLTGVPGAVLWLLVMFVQLFIAQWLAASTWKAIGPVARSVLRPLMFFGPWPFLISAGLVLLVGFGVVRGAVSGELFAAARLEGENWKVFPLDAHERRGVTAGKAEVRCRELGDAWRVPTRDDFAVMRPRFEARQAFWAADVNGAQLTEWTCRHGPCRRTWAQPGSVDLAAFVVCFRPAP